MNPIDLGIAELTTALARGELTWSDLLAAYQGRIAAKNPLLNAYVVWFDGSAELGSGALRGVPVAIKDIIDCAGFPTRAGSSFYLASAPGDAAAVRRLREAGAWFPGKTNTHEFAAGGTTLNPHFGPTRNPWDPARMVGGSSGGSAAAVAARMAVAALGTDTAGSVRIPAAMCGIVGLKPTYGRVSRRGVVPLSWSLDHVGPLARSVDDAEAIYRCIAGVDPEDPTTGFGQESREVPARFRIGLVDPPKGFGVPLQAEVEQATRQAAEWLSHQGHVVEPVELPLWEASLAANFTIIRAESATVHRQWFRAHPQAYGEDVRAYLEAGLRISAVDYLEAQRVRTVVVEAYRDLWTRFELLLLPTIPTLPPTIAEHPRLGAPLTQGTAPFDLSGLPALSVPVLAPSGLPVGIQLVAPWWQENWLFAAGRQLEVARGPMRWPD